MGIATALVDRARTVEKMRTGTRVAGRMEYAEVSGNWFRARLDVGAEPETTDAVTGARPVTARATLLFALRDERGEDIAVTNQTRVEVVPSDVRLARAEWDVTGDPQPIRKKRAVIGWQVPVQRVVVHEAA